MVRRLLDIIRRRFQDNIRPRRTLENGRPIHVYASGAVLVVLAASLTTLLVAGGCKSKARQISEHPFFLSLCDEHWDIARRSLGSDQPNISYAAVLLNDLSALQESMHRTYEGRNREAAVAKIDEVLGSFRKDMEAVLDFRYGVALRPNKTPKDVADGVEKAYQNYLVFAQMVKGK